MNLTLDAILSDGLDAAGELEPHAMLALAMKLQGAASILFARAVAALASTAASATTERAPKPDNRLISIKDAALRINKHRSWLDRHGRRLGIMICDPTTGRALGCSEAAIRRFVEGGATNAPPPPRAHASFVSVDELRAQERESRARRQ